MPPQDVPLLPDSLTVEVGRQYWLGKIAGRDAWDWKLGEAGRSRASVDSVGVLKVFQPGPIDLQYQHALGGTFDAKLASRTVPAPGRQFPVPPEISVRGKNGFERAMIVNSNEEAAYVWIRKLDGFSGLPEYPTIDYSNHSLLLILRNVPVYSTWPAEVTHVESGPPSVVHLTVPFNLQRNQPVPAAAILRLEMIETPKVPPGSLVNLDGHMAPAERPYTDSTPAPVPESEPLVVPEPSLACVGQEVTVTGRALLSNEEVEVYLAAEPGASQSFIAPGAPNEKLGTAWTRADGTLTFKFLVQQSHLGLVTDDRALMLVVVTPAATGAKRVGTSPIGLCPAGSPR